MKLLRILAKIFVVCLRLCLTPIMFAFWLFVFTPILLFIITIVNIIEFGSYGEEELLIPYDIIFGFFWLFVMFNPEKADKYI